MLGRIAFSHPFIEIPSQIVDPIGAPPQLALADRQDAYANTTTEHRFSHSTGFRQTCTYELEEFFEAKGQNLVGPPIKTWVQLRVGSRANSVDSKLTCPVYGAQDLSGFLFLTVSAAYRNFGAQGWPTLNDHGLARSLGRPPAAARGRVGLDQSTIGVIAG